MVSLIFALQINKYKAMSAKTKKQFLYNILTFWKAISWCIFMLNFLFLYRCFYKHIKFQRLGSVMFKATQNMDWKYAYGMLIFVKKCLKWKVTASKAWRPATFLKINSSTDIFLGFCFNFLVVLYYILEC